MLTQLYKDVQRNQMASLPDSHKQTILLQWKKKKAAMQQRRSSVSSPPYAAGLTMLYLRQAYSITCRGSPAQSRIHAPSPLANSRVIPTVVATPPAEEKGKPTLTVTPSADSSVLATLEARKQEKMEALRKLKEELALKRQLAQKGIQKEELSPEQLQSLMNDLQEQRRLRREAREQKMMAKGTHLHALEKTRVNVRCFMQLSK